ncbi:MAG: TolC family protein [Pseudomonadota bacterium]|nr:TolC family protein [Pseudomonadota bacterium]
MFSAPVQAQDTLTVQGAPQTSADRNEAVLTLEETLARARGDQPAIAAFAREAIASEEEAVAARSLPDLQVSVGIQNFPITGDDAFSPTDAFMTMYTIGVMREQVRRSRREAEAAQLRAEAAVSRAQGSAQVLDIEREVMIAWIKAVEAAAKQRLLIQIISDLRVGRSVMEAAIATGGSNAALALAAQAEIALSQAQLAAARGAEGRARGELARWIGAAAQRPLPNAVPVLTPPTEIGLTATDRGHPRIAASAAQELAAQGQVEVAQSERRSNLSWSVMLGLRPEFGHMLSAQVSVPLQINRRGLQNRRIAAAQSRSEAARLRTQDVGRELGASYATALAEYQNAAAAVAQLQDNAIPALEASFKAAEARYAGGQGTLELPLDIVRRYVEANLELVEQQSARAQAAAELIYLVGGTPR